MSLPQPRLLAAACTAALLLAGLAACGSSPAPAGAAAAAPTGSPSPSPTASPTPAPPPLAELPRGGRSIFPEFTVVGYYGTVAGRGDLGVLGHGTPAAEAAALEQAAAPYAAAGGRPVLPAFELITTVAQKSPGDGSYSSPLSDADVQTYLDAARAAKVYLVLDLQPGTARFVDQARRYEKFLRQPDVGLGLDPEWKLQPGQKPKGQIGSTDAVEVNEVGAYLQQLVTEGNLPEKLFVVHQFRATMIANREQVVAQPGLATLIHIDGFGGQQIKRQVYGALSLKNGEFYNGFKLFYDEDTGMLTPPEAMALVPRPDLITYQ